jgi:serine/threonine protein kinase
MSSVVPSGRATSKISALLASTPYRPQHFLGRGGMGEVWVCQHEFLLRRFAIKVLHSHLAPHADRMRFEAEATGRIRHPNVVEVVDSWLAPDGRPCIAMELLEGRSLWDELKDRVRLPVDEAVAITAQALSALSAAHTIGVVHRDIKPENLFLHRPRNAQSTLKVLDFGIGRVLPDAPAEAPAPPNMRTATGTLIGSPRFMSPEGRRGEPVDSRADLFSLGLVLYLMLTGVTPDNVGAMEAEPPSRVAGGSVSNELDALVLRAIRENPADRFQTAEQFSLALRPFLPAPTRHAFR